MQDNEKAWQQIDNRYHFNVIFFYRHDLTPWGQNFLVKKVDDPRWVPVFLDDYAIIFGKNNKKNQSVIKKFQIPREYFQIEKK